jgi:5-methyltetrahydropteroyltriglutamate--homocysteine methyltransferase
MANIFTREDRVLTTHAGLPRSRAAIDLIRARAADDYDPDAYEAQVSATVEACVRRQTESGIDIVVNGEEKSGFALYLEDRIAGLEPRPDDEPAGFKAEYATFLEDFAQYLRAALRNGAAVARMPVVCAGPIE